jgi:hypothetical protein
MNNLQKIFPLKNTQKAKENISAGAKNGDINPSRKERGEKKGKRPADSPAKNVKSPENRTIYFVLNAEFIP